MMQLDRPGAVQEALVEIGDLPLLAALSDAAARLGLPTEDFAALATRRFVERADDQDWLQLSAVMGRAEAPGLEAIRAILRRAVADAHELAA
jgi:hypothetical protein